MELSRHSVFCDGQRPLNAMAITLENGNRKPEAGFALLIAVIFMSVMLSFGLSLGSLSYKQQILASSAIQSQYAFYAADAGLECALYYDQQLNYFDYNSNNQNEHPEMIKCGGSTAEEINYSYTTDMLIAKQRINFDSLCVDVTVYKYKPTQQNTPTTYIFSQGYDVPCSTVGDPNGARFVARGISTHY